MSECRKHGYYQNVNGCPDCSAWRRDVIESHDFSKPILALRLKVGDAVIVLLEDGKRHPGEVIYDPVAEELQARVIPKPGNCLICNKPRCSDCGSCHEHWQKGGRDNG